MAQIQFRIFIHISATLTDSSAVISDNIIAIDSNMVISSINLCIEILNIHYKKKQIAREIINIKI